MPNLYLSAAHKSSGKTTVTLGLCRALCDRGLKVQVFKKGPDYIDPIWHGLASRQPSYNLDFHMMEQDEIINLFHRHARMADLSLIEGNKGLYDGMDVEGSNSNAALAKLLGAPVVLVLDSVGMTRGIAPLILGYQAFDPAINIAGVILNKVGGPRHEEKLRAVIERYTDVKVLGAVRMDTDLAIVERHLGLMPGNESDQAETRIETIADRIKAQVDLDALIDTAKLARPPFVSESIDIPQKREAGLKLAYARDKSFGFYYQEDLDTLRAADVRLTPLDTLADQHLPDVDGLIIGGGFPEMFIDELAGNRSLRAEIRHAVAEGLPVYAECGGLMYLSRSLRWNDMRGDMVGVIPGDAVMGTRPVGRGYASLSETENGLWPAQSDSIPAHEFHYSHLENLAPSLTYAYRVLRGQGIDGLHDGIVQRNLLASYCHRRGSGPRGWIAPFLNKVEAYRTSRNASV
ncbi:MAG: cobyrinic acid a,c-diamide synthase [Hydrogenophilales bacterium 28-61-23]|nr:MAG: cobyrinic acid a,c-diamide synthase [Hydrogenophilales bacterium 28-61-23]